MRGSTYHGGARWLCVALFGCMACEQRVPQPVSWVRRAEFGLFFGGQIQQRTEFPFDLDTTHQVLGFRLLFEKKLIESTTVEWILNYPTERNGQRGPSNARRAERSERASLPIGADRFEQTLPLRESDVPGTFNIRIYVADAIVLDRPFRIVPKQLTDDE